MNNGWHARDADELPHALKTSLTEGLSSEEAQKRALEKGLNVLPEKRGRSMWALFFSQFRNPLIYLLFAAAVITFFLGRASDPIVVLAIAFYNAVLGTFQEMRAERSLRSLKVFSTTLTRVIRSGKAQMVDSKQVVVGDLLFLKGGDAVVADARIVESVHLEVTEAALTGESAMVSKGHEGAYSHETLLVDRANMLHAGTFVTQGSVKAIVVATGQETEFGKIVRLTEGAQPKKTPFEERIGRLGKKIAILAVSLAVLLVIIGLWRGISKSDILLAGVSELVSVIPEGLPIAITLALALGSYRMAKKKALVRKLSAVEAMGSTGVICSDKTGTLTTGKMEIFEVMGDVQEMASAALLVAEESGNITERVLYKWAKDRFVGEKKKKTGELPFDASKKMAAAYAGGDLYFMGAPETLFDLTKETWEIGKWTKSGKRVIAFAKGTSSQDAKLIGLVVLWDPPREEVYQAVQECFTAGIRPVMITGDHLDTAIFIAEKIGIKTSGNEAIDGAHLAHLSDEELEKVIGNIAVFARVHPEQKMRIVHALKKRGEIVAMTGDGVNDAPALASADVGVAMGETGTDLAKDAANMVVLDDNFATIIDAIREGRVVFNNIKKLVFYLLATSLAGAFLMVLATFLGFPLPIHPLQILWINVITEGTITLILIWDYPEGDEMHRPPFGKEEHILSPSKLLNMAWVTPLITLFLFFYFSWGYKRGVPLDQIRSETFTLFAFCAWFKLLNCRSEKKSALNLDIFKKGILAMGIFLSVALQLLVLYIPFMNAFFYTVPLKVSTLFILLAIASLVMWAEEIRKVFVRKRAK